MIPIKSIDTISLNSYWLNYKKQDQIIGALKRIDL